MPAAADRNEMERARSVIASGEPHSVRRCVLAHTPAASRRRALVRRGRRLVRVTEALLRTSDCLAYEEPDDLGTLVAQLEVLMTEVSERLAAGVVEADGPSLAELGSSLVELHRFRSDVHDHEVHERLNRLEAMEASLPQLRYIDDPDRLLCKACEAVVHSCGFDRAMLSRVEDSIWRPWKSYAVNDRHFERAFRRWLATTPEIPLSHLLLENEMIRRRAPALVTNPDDDPRVYRPMAEASALKSYVAAPLMPTGKVIGFLHADYENAVVTELDRDILWAFAEAFGQIFERAVLLARLRHQRDEVRRAMHLVEGVLDDLASADIELAGHDLRRGDVMTVPRLSQAASLSPMSRIESLLTPRELEVLALMATGATNSRIAERLVITDGTVKSHVKRILRKLRSANRSEAVARYLKLTMGQRSAR
jgi:LuxR family transcriptional regulator, regulator of acetate metabolism